MTDLAKHIFEMAVAMNRVGAAAMRESTPAEKLIKEAATMPCPESIREPSHPRIWWLANNAQGVDMTDDDRLAILSEIEWLTQDSGARFRPAGWKQTP